MQGPSPPYLNTNQRERAKQTQTTY